MMTQEDNPGNICDLYDITSMVMCMAPIAEFPEMVQRPITKILARNHNHFQTLCKKYLCEIVEMFSTKIEFIYSDELDMFIAFAPAFIDHLCPVEINDLYKTGLPNFIAVALALNDFKYKPRGVALAQHGEDKPKKYLFCKTIFEKISKKYALPWIKQLEIEDLEEEDEVIKKLYMQKKLQLFNPGATKPTMEIPSSQYAEPVEDDSEENNDAMFLPLVAAVGKGETGKQKLSMGFLVTYSLEEYEEVKERVKKSFQKFPLADVEKNEIAFKNLSVKFQPDDVYKYEPEIDNDIPSSDVDEDEQNLANKLKNLCVFGKEPHDRLEETSQILFDLGKHYVKKAPYGTCMQQKLDFIRASALLNGAIVRFKITENYSKVKEAEKQLKILGNEALKAAKAERSEEDMLEFSKKALEDLMKLRRDHKAMLDAIPTIPDEVKGESLKSLERDKIELVEKAAEFTTKRYLSIMKNISDECIQLLGTVPCRFAAAGLGSLAREEITPYSDYEHVLILEEDVKKRDDYEKIKEYFRWYSVLFQMIMINFGETFIRSVGVKSLNDLYSNEKGKNWFYDAVTPCGVAFDGMAPQACSTPLGRQELTEKRRHVLELIQPASEMAKFVASDEHLKNGYYLRELVLSTCFVNGDKEVYGHFISELSKFMKIERIIEEIKPAVRLLSRNVNFHVMNFSPVGENEMINTKVRMYRPVVTRIGFWGRLLRIDETSCFRILREMWKKGILNDGQLHELEYLLAVACEIRFRVYSDQGHQRHAVSAKHLQNLIGKKCLVTFCNLLCKTVKKPDVPLGPEGKVIYEEDKQMKNYVLEQLAILIKLNFQEDALKIAKRFLADGYVSAPALQHCMAFCYFVIGVREKNKEYLRKCIDVVEAMKSDKSVLYNRLKPLSLWYKAECEARLGWMENLRQTIKGFLKKFEGTVNPDVINILTRMRSLNQLAFREKSVKRVDDETLDAQVKQLQEKISKQSSLYDKIKWMLILSKFHEQSEHIKEAKEVLLDIFSITATTSGLSEEERLNTLHDLVSEFQDVNCDPELIQCMDLIESPTFKNTARNKAQVKEEQQFPYFRCESLLMLGKAEECIDLCRKYLRKVLSRDVEARIMETECNAHMILAQSSQSLDEAKDQYMYALRLIQGIKETEIYKRSELYGSILLKLVIFLVENNLEAENVILYLRRASSSVHREMMQMIYDQVIQCWRCLQDELQSTRNLHFSVEEFAIRRYWQRILLCISIRLEMQI